MRHIIAVSLTNWIGYFQASSAWLKLVLFRDTALFNLLRAIQGVYPVNFLIRRLIKKKLFLKNTEFFSKIQTLKSKTGNTNLTYVLNWVFLN